MLFCCKFFIYINFFHVHQHGVFICIVCCAVWLVDITLAMQDGVTIRTSVLGRYGETLNNRNNIPKQNMTCIHT
jgi:hypothetical protein